MSERDPDGAEIVALARTLGVIGMRPAGSDAEVLPGNPPADTAARDDGADVIALARSIGLSGIRPLAANSRRDASS